MEQTASGARRYRLGSIAGATLRGAVSVAGTLWSAGAIYVDGPFGMAGGNAWLAAGWVFSTVALVWFARGAVRRTVAWLACMAVVAIPWFAISPSNDRDWQPEWAETGWAVVRGDELVFHNVRNFDYGITGEVTERWDTRTMRFSNLRGVDYVHTAFGGDFIAHPMISFDFGPDGRIVLSIETRRERGESYSEIGGLYKMFELQYLWGDERDFVRLRTNVRGEPVYLYRSTLSREEVLTVLMDSIRSHNALRDEPRFYNVLTANCTTSFRAQTPKSRRHRFDIRMLANGRLDELVYERGGFRTDGLPFEQLRERVLINSAAEAAHDDPDFSERIREGRPGFQ